MEVSFFRFDLLYVPLKHLNMNQYHSHKLLRYFCTMSSFPAKRNRFTWYIIGYFHKRFVEDTIENSWQALKLACDNLWRRESRWLATLHLTHRPGLAISITHNLWARRGGKTRFVVYPYRNRPRADHICVSGDLGRLHGLQLLEREKTYSMGKISTDFSGNKNICWNAKEIKPKPTSPTKDIVFSWSSWNRSEASMMDIFSNGLFKIASPYI